MPDLTVPPGVWTALPDGGAVLNESGANAVVTIEGGEIRFSAAMRWRRPAPQVVYAVVHGNYYPREVLALYDNAEAAARHIARESHSGWHLEVSQWAVETSYYDGTVPPGLHDPDRQFPPTEEVPRG